jgi:16S rRNA (cytidine1402-2'-O)-methyltransferase
VTLRVLDALRFAETIAAEDTRVTSKLLARHSISKKMVRCDEHTVDRIAPSLIERMLSGERVAFVSDAGTPGVSDPGARLVAAALAAGVQVEALPGASAVLAALVASGLPMRRFYFGGFLPRKAGERARELDAIRSLDATLVFYESPRRAATTLAALAQAYPGRAAVLARELTKVYEEVVRGTIEDVAEKIAARDSLKGEVVLLVGPPSSAAPSGPTLVDEAVVHAKMRALMAAGTTRSEAARQVSKEIGIPRSRVYDLSREA